MEETNGTESRRTIRRWLVQIPDHSIDERVFMAGFEVP